MHVTEGIHRFSTTPRTSYKYHSKTVDVRRFGLDEGSVEVGMVGLVGVGNWTGQSGDADADVKT